MIDAPTFISQVMGDTEKEGGIAFYICSSTGGPVPTISWYFNDVPVDVTNTVKYDVLLTSPGQSILRVNNVQYRSASCYNSMYSAIHVCTP